MALEEDEDLASPIATKPIPSPIEKQKHAAGGSQASSSPHPPLADQQQQIDPNSSSSANKHTLNPRDSILSVARKFSSQPLHSSDPSVWAVLTAISNNARKRSQGVNIFLTDDEHCIGRLVEDARFRIDSTAVSGKHCKIYRKRIATKDADKGSSFSTSVLLSDSSTNGTFLNWEKLKRNSSGAKLKHGDIISFAAAPQHEMAFAFVYREALNSTPLVDGAALKRKADEFVSESKRLKGIGIGAPEGPISLDDVRSLQRSNKELRKQLESHVLTIETMREENRVAVARHESELKELKESVSQSYLNEIKELKHNLDVKQNELTQISAVSAERQQSIVDLNERLNASMQSRTDADEIINSQKSIIAEHEKQLDEERNQRREEREKALADQKAALQRAHLEAQEELKRQADSASRQERELKEVISKLQDSDKESRLLVETLRSKLEDTRDSLVLSEQKVRQLEAQVQEEQQVSLKGRKKLDALEHEIRRLKKELESEKVAREEAWAKVSALELEMAAAIRDLTVEKQKYQGARERLILRETQLRSFYSTTEEITALFTKQQEQLKAMQRTLEDEENYDNISVGIDENATKDNINEAIIRAKRTATQTPQINENARNSSAASTPRVDRVQAESTSAEASDTEKHECEFRNQEGDHTQDLEYTSVDRSVKGAFGSDIEGVGTAPQLEGDPIETEQVLETESPAHDTNLGSRHIDLNKCTTLTTETMPLDDDVQIQENGEIRAVYEGKTQSSNPDEAVAVMEDTEATGTIRTGDLVTSEVAGSWAISTAPSCLGENDSVRNEDRDDEGAANMLCMSDGLAAGSQVEATTTKLNEEREALNEMIEIVAPEFKEQFGRGVSSRASDENEASVSDSDTQGGSDEDEDADDNEIVAVGRTISDGENTEQDSDGENDVAMDDCEDEREEDSLG